MKSKLRTLFAIRLACVIIVSALSAQAGPDAAARGRQIAAEADQRARGFGDMKAKLIMILKDRRGQQTRRELEALTLEVSPGHEKSLVYFHSPRDMRGTALLTYSYREKEDQQWLYLPALRRTKRISVAGRSSPFMGSEFSHEDLVANYYTQYDYRFLKEEAIREAPCFVVERYPKYEGTGYKRQHVWFDKEEYRVLKVEFWDLKNRHLKTLELGGYRQYLGKFWEPSQARMDNHLTRESTLLKWEDYEFKTGLSESDFSRNALGRAR